MSSGYTKHRKSLRPPLVDESAHGSRRVSHFVGSMRGKDLGTQLREAVELAGNTERRRICWNIAAKILELTSGICVLVISPSYMMLARVVVSIHIFAIVACIAVFASHKTMWIQNNIAKVDLAIFLCVGVLCAAIVVVYALTGSYYYTININCNADCNDVPGVTSSTVCVQSNDASGAAQCSADKFRTYKQQLLDYDTSSWVLVAHLVMQIPSGHMCTTRVAEHLKAERLFPSRSP
ncbi:hypothetical protein HK105_202792 [Polyrhizophydium stewartii]|uniref:Transmembrane protein n=1 Tax=Polyrhizophydium stewartii TaxID=2732419 RepID=A0ABR4NDE9_9FUNG